MSTQINQYVMYGISVPFEWHYEWEAENGKDFYDTFEKFMQDSAFNLDVTHSDGIFCLFDGRDGRFIIIGKVLKKSDDDEPFIGSEEPIKIDEISNTEKLIIQSKVLEYFGLKGEFNYYFVTKYR